MFVSQTYGSLGFNPRSRMGSDILDAKTADCRHVSIHAPAWGATHRWRVSARHRQFQSTLPRGERPVLFPCPPKKACFNPRSRVGSDTLDCLLLTRKRCFNPRSRVGSDNAQWTAHGMDNVSIHAPAWGATGLSRCCRGHGRSFNPRSRVGSDTGVASNIACGVVSIHAPAWGATQTCGMPSHRQTCFNPRSRVGSDP